MNRLRVSIQKLLCTCVSALVPDRETRHRVRYALHPLNDRRCVEYFMRRYVGAAAPSPVPPDRKAGLPGDVEYIWQCWLQGPDNMPALVRNCLRSVERHRRPGQKVVLITEENYTEYVEFPDWITRKRREGRIADAQFSDLLRLWLLASYGGCWIDATCFLTAPVPENILRADLFMFRTCGEFAYTLVQSCFIRARAGDWLMLRWQRLMAELWRNEGGLLHYFQLHLMFKAMVEADCRAREEFLRMEDIPETATHVLQDYMRQNVPFSQDRLDAAARGAFMHKLTYKLRPENADGTYTFRDYFWSDGCCC